VAEIVDLKGKRAEQTGDCEHCKETIVKLLREMLADAEAGNIVQLAAVYCHKDKKVGDCWADGGYATHGLIGGLEFLKATLIANEVVERKFE
jgi:hypothetical protein